MTFAQVPVWCMLEGPGRIGQAVSVRSREIPTSECAHIPSTPAFQGWETSQECREGFGICPGVGLVGTRIAGKMSQR